MTTTITTIQRAAPRDGVSRSARRLGAALAAISDQIAAWSAPYYEKGMREPEAMLPGKRIDAALHWHARHGRLL